MFSRTHVAGLAVLAMLLTAGLLWAAEGGTLKVTVSYEGSGEVSATHPILVGISDTPHPAPAGSSIRLQGQLIEKNDDTATFEKVSWSPVYVRAMYSSEGRTVVQGLRGPVIVPRVADFSEAPMGIYGAGVFASTGAIEMVDGQTVEIDLEFDDAVRGPVIP